MLLAPPAISDRARNRGTAEYPSLWGGLLHCLVHSVDPLSTDIQNLAIDEGMRGATASTPTSDGWFNQHSTSDNLTCDPMLVDVGQPVTMFVELTVTAFAGTNPGVWRSGALSDGNWFFILQGGSNRPWIRWNGTDALKPTSGTSMPTGRQSTAFQAKSGDFKWYRNGELAHAASTSVSSSGSQTIYRIGSQVSGERVEGYYRVCSIWQRDLSSREHRLLAADPLAPIRRRRRLSLLVPELGGAAPSSGDTTDAFLISDTHLATATTPAATSDAGLIADTQAPLATSSVTTADAGLIADTQTALATVTAATSDAILAADTQSATAAAAATTVDAGLVADTQAAAAAAAVTIADSGLISDTQDGAIGASTSSATTADAALISVAFSATATVPVNTSDAILVSDNQIATAVASAAITDVALVSDTIVGAELLIGAADVFYQVRGAPAIATLRGAPTTWTLLGSPAYYRLRGDR